MAGNRIDAAFFEDKDYDSDRLSWAEHSGDSSAGFNNSDDSSDHSDHGSEDSSQDDSFDSELDSDIETEGGFFEAGFAGIRRRFSAHRRQDSDESGNSASNDYSDNSKDYRGKRSGWEPYRERCSWFCSNRSSMVLFVCFVLWLFVIVRSADTERDVRLPLRRRAFLTDEERKHLRQQRVEDSKRALGSAAQTSEDNRNRNNGLLSWIMGSGSNSKKVGVNTDKEALLPGCIPSDWHTLSFPTCNSIHEIDLRDSIFGNATSGSTFVGKGLWRVVFNVTDNGGSHGVLKMMKGEHDVDARNFDRHRRDALVMERLASSPYIVTMYSFCGNTVFTEFIGETLDEVIKNNRTVYPSRNTPRARLKLALDVAKGIQALHEVDGGPIAHTDIQSEQFLVDESGRVKLNDFNRCRFVAHRNETGEPCVFRIPTAPGAFRSPEEYEYLGLSEKLDIYSTTNVLYEILTGYEIWEDDRVSKIRAKVLNGEKPPIPSEYLQPGSPDAGLVTLIGLGHEKSPDQRINASQMVAGLESLLRANE